MTHSTKLIERLSPQGIEIDGLDLADGKHDAMVKDLFEQYGFLLFRNQKLTQDQQRRILACLGPVLDDFRTVGYVSNTRPDGILGNTEVSYHVDFIYTACPALGVSLHGIEVPYEETWTSFANGANALGRLSPKTRERIRTLKGLNIFSASEEGVKGRQSLENYPADAPRYAHPLVRVDPITKKEALFATQQNTAVIEGVPSAESEALIAEFSHALYAPENVYQHRWRNGDFVIWSNQLFHHARGELVPGKTRTLQRVCITEATPAMYDAPIPQDRLPPAMRKQ